MEALWEKLLFWKKKPKIEYKLQDHNDTTWVEITSGNYSGVVYSYGMVGLDETIGLPQLRFNYMILHSGQHTKEALQNDQNFVKIMGDILTEIIIENEPIRTNYSEESDL